MVSMDDAWARMLRELQPAAGEADALGLNPGTEEGKARTTWSLLSAAAQYVVNFRNQDPDNPQFTPLLNDVLNSNPVPDFTYRIARVRGNVRYIIKGTRGGTRFVEFQQMAGLDGHAANSGTVLGRFSLDDLEIGPDGRFEIHLGPPGVGPPGGNRIELHPDVTTLFVREGAYDWAEEEDCRLAIACLDVSEPPFMVTPENCARALEELPAWAAARVGNWTRHVRVQKEARPMGDLQVHRFAGGMLSQVYFEGYYEVEPGTALLLETDVPDACLYWSVLLTDDRYMTVDWLRHQSSLNAGQARLDPDGRFRAVVALEDPGCPNWLDPGGNRAGLIQLRWNGSASVPQPRLRPVPMATLSGHLHPATPRVSPGERAETLRQRRLGAQMRRRW